MTAIKKSLARKAVKTTARHTAHGTASKLTHKPVRATTLLAAGALAGLVLGWLLGHSGSNHPAVPSSPQPGAA